MDMLTASIQRLNCKLPFRRCQLVEICDLDYCPSFLKHLCQNTLTQQWLRRLPLLQSQSPAQLAAQAILSALDSLEDLETADWTVIDFCSGAGGPIPYVEREVNRRREREGKKAIPFRLSDIHPKICLSSLDIDAWIHLSSHSRNLSFIPQPVDASSPPFSVISATTPGDKVAAFDQGFSSDGSKVLRVYCLSFHHFDDEQAERVVRSTLETSDAFAIIELQDRRVGSLVLMVMEFWLVFFISVLWFWDEPLRLLLTYAVPALPAVHCFDGIVSCLRTRTFGEFIGLVEEVLGSKAAVRSGGSGDGRTLLSRGDWVFEHRRVLHTWPVGFMGFTFGRKMVLGR
ncbi:hypothetical protein LTR62_004507 [Meristemomyces frigidus]|uniref:Uncharacterized protein n=1 Tax=Meristemomyces frigidus TaxID=1508187 RepID=A0AAN7TGT7_9PEZI|nr:hypothetical protein LTR62_004507 [Meristemomyces frigidus]